jgi:uncharacterized protein
MTTARAASLHIYPVKALAGTALEELTVEPWGPAGDRRWMLTAPDGSQLTQREHPRLALARAQLLPLRTSGGGPGRAEAAGVRVAAPGREPLEIRVPVEAETVPVQIFRRKVEAVPAPGEASAWFSSYLGAEIQLVYMDAPERRRQIDPDYSNPGETVSFADGFPLLLTTASSLDALNSLIAQGDHADEGPLPMSRFRPNVVIEGTAPWAEDGWRRVRIGEITFRAAKSCSRCVVSTTDQSTAERGKEPLRTLARHRRFSDQLVFGQNLIPERTGRVRSGDSFEVLE